MGEDQERAMTCPECGGSGVLYILDWAYAREDGRGLDWRDAEPYTAPCHACPVGVARTKAGL